MTQQKHHSNTKAGNIIILLLCMAQAALAQVPAHFVPAYGYDSCVQMQVKNISVIIEPNAGGRVIEFSLNGKNVLYIDSSQNGWMSTPQMPRSKGHLCAGRFDIGPSRTKPDTDVFFFGKWKATITGKFSVLLTSSFNTVSKIFFQRKFELNVNTGELIITQTCFNKSSKSIASNYWGRTFVKGNGICLFPVKDPSRFPKKYAMYVNRDSINMFPSDTNIVYKNGWLIIKGPPAKPKLEADVDSSGIIASLTNNNLLFIKKYRTYANRTYGEVTAANCSIWYNGTQMTEVEPIGPYEMLLPGKSFSFSEVWSLKEFAFPQQETINENFIKQIIQLSK